ncbi:MAG TPA: hypothetical protein VKT77_00200 [Chthonomonadaceae bacterium]|nr:hypothetical protein [Chthonomonadaceae bacterium]
MAKLIKLFLFVVFPLGLMLGGAYGLAKIGVIPVKRLTARNRAARTLVRLVGLDSPRLPAVQVNAPHAAAPDPLAAERKELAGQRQALEKQRADWENVKRTQAKNAEAAAAAERAATDPKAIARLAAVYEQMPPDAVSKIFAKLPETEVLALLRKMEEKKVGEILAANAPDRAARLTLALSKPAPAAPPSAE